MEEIDFKGAKLNTSRAKLPPGFFQTDKGGDRFEEGTWRRRRGLQKLNTDKQGSPILTLAGFELFGTGFGLISVAGGQVDGYTDVALVSGTLTDPGSGFGAGAFGAGGFGA